MELIYYWKVLCKYWRVVCITQSIIGREFTNSWRWLNLVRIQFPIIEIDIPRLNLRNCPTIHLYENYTSRKSPTCPDFITILIEDQISHRFIATDCCEYFISVCTVVISSIRQRANSPLERYEFFLIYKSNVSLYHTHISIDSVSFFDHLVDMI